VSCAGLLAMNNPLPEPPWVRAGEFVQQVHTNREQREDRGYDWGGEREGRIDVLTGDLKMAALSARMAIAATRLMHTVQTEQPASRQSSGRSRTSWKSDDEVPEHVARLSQYLRENSSQGYESGEVAAGIEARVSGASSSGGGGGGDGGGGSSSSTSVVATAPEATVVSRELSIHRLEGVGLTETMRDALNCAAFVDRRYCRVGVGCVIIANMLALSLETDYADWPCWDLVNIGFLLFYIGELGLRIQSRGFMALFWTGKSWHWMIYDAIVILIGIVDWVVACLCRGDFDAAGSHHRLSVMPAWELPVVRTLMVSRVLRLYRVVNLNKKLKDFVRLLGSMLSTFAWILSIILLFCFVLSVVLTRLLGHGLIEADDPEVNRQVQDRFRDIPTSLFTLFQVTTIDDWSTIASPVVEISTCWRLFFIIFVTFMSWTMLSLLTAVASECFIADASGKKHEEQLMAEVSRQAFTTLLCSEFLRADADESGLLDKPEFIHLMSRPAMVVEMEAQGVDLKVRDLSTTWDNFDVDDSGELTIDELVDGFSFLMEDLATKHVAGVEHALKRFSRKMEVSTDTMQEAFEKVIGQKEEVLQRLAKRKERFDEQRDFIPHVKQVISSAAKEKEQAAVADPRDQDRRVAKSASTTRDKSARSSSQVDGRRSHGLSRFLAPGSSP